MKKKEKIQKLQEIESVVPGCCLNVEHDGKGRLVV